MDKKSNLELPESLEFYREKIEATIKPYIQIEITDSSFLSTLEVRRFDSNGIVL